MFLKGITSPIINLFLIVFIATRLSLSSVQLLSYHLLNYINNHHLNIYVKVEL